MPPLPSEKSRHGDLPTTAPRERPLSRALGAAVLDVRRGLGVACAAALLIVAGCGSEGDEGALPDAHTGDPETAAIRGTVTYDGARQGAITVAVFREVPDIERWQPVATDSAGGAEASVAFPWDFEIADLDPGTYHLVAFFDVGADGDGTPDPREDILVVHETPAVIGAGEVAIVGFSLADPVLGDGHVSGRLDGHPSMDGKVVVGAFDGWPPPSVGLPECYAVYDDVSFPLDYSLDCLTEGEWDIAALFYRAGSDGLSAPAFTAVYEHGPLELSAETRSHEDVDMAFPSSPGEISGIISVNADVTGAVVVGLYETFSPEGAGEPLYFQAFDVAEGASSFPLAYSLGDVPFGTYELAVSLDRDALVFESADVFTVYDQNPIVVDANDFLFEGVDLALHVDVGNVSGQVHFAGQADGAVLVGLFTSFPPEEGELPVASAEFDTAEAGFPLDFAFSSVPDGGYILAALFDTDGSGFADPEYTALYEGNPVVVGDASYDHAGLTLTFDGGLVGLGGSVDYAGSESGDLLVGLYPLGSLPPEEGTLPLDPELTFIVDDVPGFPVSYEFDFVPDGSYVLLAGFDIGGDDITLPDVLTYFDEGRPITVSDGEITDFGGAEINTADLTLPSGLGTITGKIEVLGSLTGSSVVHLYRAGADLPTAVQVFPGGGPHDFTFEDVPEGSWRVEGGFDFGDSGPLAPELESEAIEVTLVAPDDLSQVVPDIVLGHEGCSDYCAAHSIGCFVYANATECHEACALFPKGTIGDTSGDSFECRATWLQLGFEGVVAPSTACENSAPSSPECVD